MKSFFSFLIDILISFFGFGLVIGWLTNDLSLENRQLAFNLVGWPALWLVVSMGIYFLGVKKLWGKTLGQKLLDKF